ncbi:acyl-CoA thioesterase [Intestinibacillus massiliensis]|nr:acyl-CoA thioesterase [Intestinibacillus massiliensis]
MTIRPYERMTHYYETDRMGVIHHSNYLRFFEEARVDLLGQLGFSYAKMEELGVQMPVLESQCAYKKSVGFDERIRVQVALCEYTGLRVTLRYRLERAATGETCATGETRHCFVSGNTFRPLRLPRAYPEIDRVFAALAEG